jgi:hypothetical protein
MGGPKIGSTAQEGFSPFFFFFSIFLLFESQFKFQFKFKLSGSSFTTIFVQ